MTNELQTALSFVLYAAAGYIGFMVFSGIIALVVVTTALWKK